MAQPRTKAYKEAKFALVRQWEESGMTQTTFAAQNNIGITNLSYWIKKYNNQGAFQTDFIELPISIPAQQQPQEIVLKYSNGTELILPLDFSIESIKLLLEC